MSLLKVRDLQIVYGHGKKQTLIGPVSFEILPGEIFGLVGESGAGKSSVGFEVLGLLNYKHGRKTGGAVETSVKCGEIAYIPQDALSSLDPLFTIGNQMREIERNSERIKEALRRVHLPLEKMSLESYPHELSGGMRQRVLIAMALLRRPKLIIADEPTSSLDPTVQAGIVSLFKEIRDAGMTFLLITHSLPLAAALCSRVAVMSEGSIVEQGEPQVIFKTPREEYTKRLVESVPRIKR